MNLIPGRPQNADPMLLPPRDAPYVLNDVVEKIAHGSRDELVFDLGDCYLRFGVDIDTDTITSQFQPFPFRVKRGYSSVRAVAPWKAHVGKTCGWTWLAMNQQGYLDTALVAFDGIEPNVLLQVIASSIEIFVIRLAAVAPPSSGGRGRNAKAKGDPPRAVGRRA
jgi:Family of unknown function (DUF6334)